MREVDEVGKKGLLEVGNCAQTKKKKKERKKQVKHYRKLTKKEKICALIQANIFIFIVLIRCFS